MPLYLNFWERTGLLTLNEGPGPMTELLGTLSFKAVLTGIRIGLFEYLNGKVQSIDDIAAGTGFSKTGISVLLRTLETLGYVKNKQGLYANSAMTEKWLLRSSPYAIADMFESFNSMAERWEYLDRSIKDGKPPILCAEWLDKNPERWNAYHAGQKSIANLVFRELMKKIKLPKTARRILDLGGGHGRYCIEFCRRYPNLSGVIYDWPHAETIAVPTITEHAMSGRVTFQSGDFIKDSIGSGYDVILMFNVIRIFKPEELVLFFKKIFSALNPGGRLIIMDHMGHWPHSRFMRANAFLIVLELFNSTIGQTHPASEVSSHLAEAGFAGMKDSPLHRSPGLGLLTALRP